ncbi:MAG: accessory gene regulator B family protein [[Eubacterium] siraeum]|nr:MAG: hypothetical protein BHW21_04400 [Eubacterium sp. 45_250]
MINKIANGIADFVCDKKMHEKNDYERAILVYGYEIILSSALSFAAVIVLGLAFCKLFEAIIFFLTFYFIRRRTGGYHADTYFKCNLIFFLNIIAVLVVISFRISFAWQVIFNVFAFIFCFLLILMKAPIENPNKPICKSKQKKHKIIAFILLGILECISVVIINQYTYSMSISLALFSVSVAMTIKSH